MNTEGVLMWAWIMLLTFAADPYEALRAKKYDEAIAAFEQAIAAEPKKPGLRKDFAYALLKVGENAAARDQFHQAMLLDPKDEHAAMEYAFLCFETKRTAEARRIFQRLSHPTAQQAFRNIDAPLAEGIARWKEAIERSPDNFSAHEELARLADQRDEVTLAAEHYALAWRLKPEQRSLLLDLGRVWQALGRKEEAAAALLAASRGAQARVAEQARALAPARYPYVYEFRKALELDPANVELRRELAYLLLAMDRKSEAEPEFRRIVESNPEDLLSSAQLGFILLAKKDRAAAGPLLDRVLKGGDEELADRVRTALGLPQTLRRRSETPQQKTTREAKDLAEKSLQAGYLKDALKYLTIAHESDPVDFNVILKLGWTYNILKQDNEAVKWFNLARKAPNPEIKGEADRAFRNLQPAMQRFRTTLWTFPFFSSRWHDIFNYSQVKTDFRIGRLPVRPYVSLRFVGDTRGTTNTSPGVAPQYLSENSIIAALGVATRGWKGITGWFEAGESAGYRGPHSGSLLPDFRGGVAFARGFGHLLKSSGTGWFAETNDDIVFVSRFQNNTLFYLQNRAGYTFRESERTGFQAQVYWNGNLTIDTSRQYWANFAEHGPGVRFRIASMPQGLLFSINALRGHYLVQEGNPRGPMFNDFRAGFWYAFTH